MTPLGSRPGLTAVCTQAEWEAMEAVRPGCHALIRELIGSEGEAERLARDLQTPPVPDRPRPSYIDLRREARAATWK
jgi:hypothetical protein